MQWRAAATESVGPPPPSPPGVSSRDPPPAVRDVLKPERRPSLRVSSLGACGIDVNGELTTLAEGRFSPTSDPPPTHLGCSRRHPARKRRKSLEQKDDHFGFWHMLISLIISRRACRPRSARPFGSNRRGSRRQMAPFCADGPSSRTPCGGRPGQSPRAPVRSASAMTPDLAPQRTRPAGSLRQRSPGVVKAWDPGRGGFPTALRSESAGEDVGRGDLRAYRPVRHG